MSLRALPLVAVSLIFYNLVVVLAGAGAADELMRQPLFAIPMLRGARWSFSWGDLVVLLTMVMLFVELLKSTYTSTTSLIDHGLSMIVFVISLVEFLMVDAAATSPFFFILVASFIDVVAGYTIGIRVARRDLSIGADT
jgi:hypothetical protein